MPDQETHMDRRDNAWRINKEIPLSVLITLVIQTLTAIVFIVKMDSRITVLEERRVEDKAANAAVAALPERLMRTEIEVQNMKLSVNRLELKIDQMSIEQAKRNMQ